MFHSEFTAPMFHKGIDLDKASRIQKRVNPLAGGFLSLSVLSFHLRLPSTGNDLGAASEKILHLVIHRFFYPHDFTRSQSSTRTPWVSFGCRKAIRAPPAP